MGCWMRRCVTVVMVVVVVTGFLGVDADAQTMARVRGEVTDEWGNGLEGVTVSGRLGDSEAREATTNDDGRFNLVNLPSGEWVIEFRLAGYQATGVAMQLEQRDARGGRPFEIELAASPPGSRVRDDIEFETEDGGITVKLKGDGQFEFEDTEGKGEGTYGIVELEGHLTVRDYDGDDDKFSVAEPVVVTFPNALYSSLTWGPATLRKK